MNMEEKIEAAGKKKEEGNAPFKADEYARASKRYEKGCRPYMCEASYRHSNCLDQFHKSLSKPPSTVPLQEEMPPSDTVIPHGNFRSNGKNVGFKGMETKDWPKRHKQRTE